MKDRRAVPGSGSRRAVGLADLAQLVRAPAALSVPGDVLAGAAAAGRPLGARTFGVMASSVCLYWAGMALNDYADATIDAVERPERPVPSGRVPRGTALAVAGALTAGGLALAAAAGGRRGLLGALPLAGAVWAYDLKLKSTPAGPAAMASARALDVLGGALAAGRGTDRTTGTGAALLRGAVPAALVGAHTYTLTALSRHEISGAPARLPAATLAASTATALAAALPAVRTAVAWHAGRLPAGDATTTAARPGTTAAGARTRGSAVTAGVSPLTAARAVVVAAGALAYLGSYGTAQARAVREPSGENVRRAVGAGILGLMPLQAALTARSGATAAAAALGVVHPLARRLARRISPT
ncbi:UbiA family prenyltransferase [Streptomyces europaeiscabiei]|uniref:SCO3242 family prenyltransferase n=1 Tax=Streptomyces TaxID=1883 RepID=UPI00211B6BA6|nr:MULTISPECIES: UbiA family prenyltransferase [Streptomyces]MDX3632454.1 UbiA family prenyltransferase [Streptomyces europaeiscabiei]MDX3646737.1 UbiA family prenyltransferase [Streptomyces europaeiscabiei]